MQQVIFMKCSFLKSSRKCTFFLIVCVCLLVVPIGILQNNHLLRFHGKSCKKSDEADFFGMPFCCTVKPLTQQRKSKRSHGNKFLSSFLSTNSDGVSVVDKGGGSL